MHGVPVELPGRGRDGINSKHQIHGEEFQRNRDLLSERQGVGTSYPRARSVGRRNVGGVPGSGRAYQPARKRYRHARLGTGHARRARRRRAPPGGDCAWGGSRPAPWLAGGAQGPGADQGDPHHVGSLIYEDYIPEEDDLIVERLRRAGAITVGKTNTPEFARAPRPTTKYSARRSTRTTPPRRAAAPAAARRWPSPAGWCPSRMGAIWAAPCATPPPSATSLASGRLSAGCPPGLLHRRPGPRSPRRARWRVRYGTSP